MMRLALVLMAVMLATPARAAPPSIPATDFAAFAFDQHPGAQLPLDDVLNGVDGRPVRLGNLFDGKPVLIDFEYDRCTTLCGVTLDQITAALRSLPLQPGRDYRFVAIDIDPGAMPRQAESFAKAHGVIGEGTSVLTGDEIAIRRLADAAGFPYRRDPATGQYAHPAGFLVATPSGAISRYLLGFDWRPFDLRLALTEAGNGKVGGIVDRVLLTCFRYDPTARRYGIYVVGMLKGGGLLVLLTMGVCLTALWRRDLALRREHAESEPDGSDRERLR